MVGGISLAVLAESGEVHEIGSGVLARIMGCFQHEPPVCVTLAELIQFRRGTEQRAPRCAQIPSPLDQNTDDYIEKSEARISRFVNIGIATVLVLLLVEFCRRMSDT